MPKIYCIIGLALLLLFYTRPCTAQGMPKTYSEHRSGKLEYGLFVPANYDSTQQYPLVMYLHGWSSNYTVYLNFYNSSFQTNYPCFVFTPKTPTDWGDWSSWSWEGTTFSSLSAPTKAAMQVLDSLCGTYAIDTNRLYVYGISMGGEGVFDLLHKLPGKFAAGISICGGGFAHWAKAIAETPLWMFHGSADDVNPPEITERVYNSLLQMGATNMRYTNYPGYGHEIWDKAQSEPSFYDWMFAFDKSATSYTPPSGTLSLSAEQGDKLTLKWNNIRDEASLPNKIWYYEIYNTQGLMRTLEYNKNQYSFTPANETDTFKIRAINYWFQPTAFSNEVVYGTGQGSNTVPKTNDKKKVKLSRHNKSIELELPDEQAQAFTVQLIGLDGKLLFSQKYGIQEHVSINTAPFDAAVVLVQVIIGKELWVQKVQLN